MSHKGGGVGSRQIYIDEGVGVGGGGWGGGACSKQIHVAEH